MKTTQIDKFFIFLMGFSWGMSIAVFINVLLN